MPVTLPATSERTFTPTSVEEASESFAVPGAAEEIQMLNGPGPRLAMVVKDQVTGEVIVLPDRSLAPLTVAVYVLELPSAALGVSVAALVELLYVMADAPVLWAGPFSTKEMVEAWSGALKVAVAVVVVLPLVAFDAGVWPVTVGGVV